MSGAEHDRIARLEGMISAAEQSARWTVLDRQSSDFLHLVADKYGPRTGNVIRGDQRLLGLEAWRVLRKRNLVKFDKARPE